MLFRFSVGRTMAGAFVRGHSHGLRGSLAVTRPTWPRAQPGRLWALRWR